MYGFLAILDIIDHNEYTSARSIYRPKLSRETNKLKMDAPNNTNSLLINAVSEDTELTLIDFSGAEIVSLAFYCLVMVFFGLAGNGTVLYSSFRYNALRLDKASLMFVQN